MALDYFEFVEPGVRSHPERSALLTAHGESISYGRLGRIIEAYAARAHQAGIARGANVVLHGMTMAQYLCMVVALSRLGAVHVRASDEPDPAGQEARVDHVVVDAGAGLRGPKVVGLDFRWPDEGARAEPVPMPGFESEDDTCLITTTSGTTGRKKQLACNLALFRQWAKDQANNSVVLGGRTLLGIPPATGYGLLLAFRALLSGGQVILPGDSTTHILGLIATGQVDEIFAAPAIFAQLVQDLKQRPARAPLLSRAIMAGSLASPDLIKSIQTYICPTVLNFYGSTELGLCAMANVDDVASVPEGVAMVVPLVEVRMLDDDGRELPPGEFGRLQFRARPGRIVPCPFEDLAGGANRLKDWFEPGDLGTVTGDGVLCIRSRQADLINTGGNKIAPSLVEERVVKLLGASEIACAFGLPGPGGFDEVVVVIDARNAGRLKELPAHLEGSGLGLGKIHLLAIKSFPLNDAGKIDRQKLRALATSEIARQKARGTR